MGELYHYGTPHAGMTPHSGRYAWGSGKKGAKGTKDNYAFLAEYRALKAELNEYSKQRTDKEIADLMGISTTVLRQKRSEATANEQAANIAKAIRLRDDKGYGPSEIGRQMHVNESTVRGWLKRSEGERAQRINNTAEILKDRLKEVRFVDVGSGVESEIGEMGVSKETLKTALNSLKEQGYVITTLDIQQANNKQQYTKVKVLAPPGTTIKEINQNRDQIESFVDYSPNNGLDWIKPEYPKSIDRNRIYVRYAEEGGKAKDGTIEVRRGVEDVSLGENAYAQVRVAVDGKYYMKGMAFYGTDIPKGYDVVYNSNKPLGSPDSKVFKELKNDPENPFGAVIKAGGQRWYDDPNGTRIDPVTGKKQSQSVINIINEEDDWDKYSKKIASQMLSKQKLPLVKQQLDLTFKEKQAEYEEIRSYTNDAIRAKMLKDFAEECDSSAKTLAAISFPKQSTKVLLPVPTLKENECYCPALATGTEVALVRYPHGGTFEIPICKVNNNNKQGKEMFNSVDAIGINPATASRLSGADFDGDFAIVIPTKDRQGNTITPITSTAKNPMFDTLKNFDTGRYYSADIEKYRIMVEKGATKEEIKNEFGYIPKRKPMTDKEKGIQMGMTTNLITDMQIQDAKPEEIIRATKHSMVVIDAQKHDLDWRQSEQDYGIKALYEKYQGKKTGGASTIISRAKNEVYMDQVKRSYKPNENGEWEYEFTGKTYSKAKRDSNKNIVTDDDGEPIYETKKYQSKMARMDLVKDARELMSTPKGSAVEHEGTPIEMAYANYANKMKAMANAARKEAYSISPTPVSKEAKETYANEVAELNAKLNNAKKNAPKERIAQTKASAEINEKMRAYRNKYGTNMDGDDEKKLRRTTIAKYRAQVGSGKKDVLINITDREWEAIQNHAISYSKMTDILNNTDMDSVKQRALPKNNNYGNISPSRARIIQQLLQSGQSPQDIADRYNISVSTVRKYRKGVDAIED